DPAWNHGNYTSIPVNGVRIWRDIFFAVARTPEMYRDQFANPLDVLPWLKTQEDAVLSVFDPNDYIYQSWAYESHDVGATPGMSRDYAKALRAIKAKTLIMTGVKDLLNPEWEPLEAARHIRDVRTVTISPESVTRHFAGGAAPATIAILRTLEIFRAFSGPEIETLASRMTWRAVQAGQTLFREGDVGDEMYFVLSGQLVISKAVAHNVDKVLTRMGPGEFFGEMNLFGGLQRSATVQAEADTELLVLDRDTLTAVVGQNPPAGLAFFSALVREF